MRVSVYWNDKRGEFAIRHKGVNVAYAKTVLVRDPDYRRNGTPGPLIMGELEAFKGETTRAGDERGLWAIWTGCDDRYRAHAGKTGRFVHFAEGEGWKLTETGAPHCKGEMVYLSRHKGRAAVLDFDPCTMPELVL